MDYTELNPPKTPQGNREREELQEQSIKNLWAETTMPNPHLPVETLDDVVDLLQGEERALRNCCLVSKPWSPRTREHLFANIRFYTEASLTG